METSTWPLGRLHSAQAGVYEALTSRRPPKIAVLACGARWGKDRLCMYLLLHWAMRMATVEHDRRQREQLIPRVLCWYVAPTFALLRQAWDEITEFAGEVPGVKFNRAELRVYLPGDVQIEFKSADRPGGLLSRGLDLVVCTEAARIKRDAWENAILTRLASPGRGPWGRGGLAILNSTPNGKNWFYDLWARASADTSGYMRAWRFSSYDNPGIQRRLLDAQRELVPERVFAQEYMAEFLDGGGSVFRRVSDCLQAYPYPAPAHGPVCIGIDWGRHNDRTAVVAVCLEHSGCCRVVDHRLLVKMPYDAQLAAIKAVADRYPGASLVAETNGLGDPLVERLRTTTHRHIIPFATTSASKRAIIETAVTLMEQGAIALPGREEHGVMVSLCPELTAELGEYECVEHAGGSMSYSAPAGKHDDLVMALCFALAGRQAARKTGRIEAF